MEETKKNSSLGQRITFYRKKLGLQQKILADKIGVTATALNYYEKDKSKPNILTLRKMAETFSITLDELAGFDSPKMKIKNGSEYTLVTSYRLLNQLGQIEAVKRVSELSEIPKYKELS